MLNYQRVVPTLITPPCFSVKIPTLEHIPIAQDFKLWIDPDSFGQRYCHVLLLTHSRLVSSGLTHDTFPFQELFQFPGFN